MAIQVNQLFMVLLYFAVGINIFFSSQVTFPQRIDY